MNLYGKTVLVLGMGETGLSMVKWLSRIGSNIFVADDRIEPPNLGILEQIIPVDQIFTGSFSTEILKGIDIIAISPGISKAIPLIYQAAKRQIPVVGDIELFSLVLNKCSALKPKVLAITGSNGKTTVSSMVDAMLREAGWDIEVAGNIGPAILNKFMQRIDSGKPPQAWVLEISSFQLESTKNFNPDVAAVLNLSEDHLDRYVDMADYAATKARIFSGEIENGGMVQILNRDDPIASTMAIAGKKQITFGMDAPVNRNDFGLLVDDETWIVQGRDRLIKVSELVVTGPHNIANALAALALCNAVGAAYSPILNALRKFTGLPHRVERVVILDGITFYNDSKGTNVGATVAAINSITQKKILIIGGDGKKQDFSPLKEPISKSVRAVILIGKDARKIGAAIGGCGVPLHSTITLEDAVKKSFILAKEGDAVLMSPACSSTDMFRNYIHRAEVYIAAIKKLELKMLDTKRVIH
ncbi:MAG: UDP-N-acetylmuramoyl-L-alanine--D-glutamate ligase [Nitrosomonadaceae bacterium]|nr:UDP-N-acetylmuramoyl-L-alanine--D-glutamate ligase [Nitrosomonadaceae bacterium]|tara:strand:- start:17160 stop:18575 length:1416 start_codon:yes stop_codon:yes gene_type:complete